MKIQQLFERQDQVAKIIALLEGRAEYIDENGEPQKVDTIEKLIKGALPYLGYHLKEMKPTGYFSYVYKGSETADFVLKYSAPQRYSSDGWFSFANTVRFAGNSLFPKIKFLGEMPYKVPQDVRGIAIIEALQMDVDRCEKIGIKWNDYDRMKRLFTDDLIDYYTSIISPETKEMCELFFKEFNVDPKEMRDFLKVVRKINGTMDIHQHNIGWRPNGECVIFDPISSISTT
jgi:hypothetical protein